MKITTQKISLVADEKIVISCSHPTQLVENKEILLSALPTSDKEAVRAFINAVPYAEIILPTISDTVEVAVSIKSFTQQAGSHTVETIPTDEEGATLFRQVLSLLTDLLLIY